MTRTLAHLTGVIVVCTIVQSPSLAIAGTVTFNNIVATWSNVQGGSSIAFAGNGTNNATVTWGTPSGGTKSGYTFSGITGSLDTTLPPSPTPEFIIGTFTHSNQPIAGGTSISGVRLTIGADVFVDSSFLGTYSFVYDVSHWETLNSATPCADGGIQGVGVNVNGCADRVQTSYNSLSDSFQIGADLYTLDIRGFELLDHTQVLNFWTAESSNNQVYLLARAMLTGDATDEDDGDGSDEGDDTDDDTTIQNVPEPGTAALLITGMVVVGLRERRARPRAR